MRRQEFTDALDDCVDAGAITSAGRTYLTRLYESDSHHDFVVRHVEELIDGIQRRSFEEEERAYKQDAAARFGLRPEDVA